MTTSGRFWPTPRVSADRASRGSLTAKHWSAVGLGQAVELAEGILSREFATEDELTPGARRLWTSSLEASPVSHGAPPESSAAREMTAISGRNLRELFDPPDRVTAFLRMCRESSVWRVALTEYSLTWKRSATPQGRSLYRLRLSGPTTAETASGLWLTPAAMTQNGGEPSLTEGMARRNHATGNLHEQVAATLWPTPRMEGFDAGSHRGNPDSLHARVKMLHTPTSKANQISPSMVERDSGSYGHGMLPSPMPSDVTGGRTTKGKHRQNETGIRAQVVEPGQKLSAAWVNRLQGYPDGWLDLED
jgi:hypothetical protein